MQNNTRPKILVVEDQDDISELIKLHLETHGHELKIASNIAKAKELLEEQKFDLFLVDRMLPDGSGLDLCIDLKSDPKTESVPIIFITALTEPENIIEGLDAGASDYIAKPFDLNILSARVRAHLRSRLLQNKNRNLLKVHQIIIDDNKKTVSIIDESEGRSKAENINLTLTEYNILKHFVANPGVVHSRRELIKNILGEDIFVTDRVIDTHIVGLRKKIKTQAKWIETIRGVGYRFREV